MFTKSTNSLISLLIIAFGLNFNTLFHEYALDDIVVLTENKFVIKGIAGIPEILSNDLMAGYSTNENLLNQPRYRPFFLIIFALEYEIFGANPFVSHLINVLLFLLLIALLFRLLNNSIFRGQDGSIAFLSCLLFAVHPVHTEVIANIKSRDELLAFILIISSAILLIKYSENRSFVSITLSLLCFFLALLTRESAVTFIAIVPLIFFFFYNKSVNKSIQYTFPLILVFGAYISIRYSIIGNSKTAVTDILNAPYLYASSLQAFATKIYILSKYLLLLIFPHPLSSDYSYNQIPYIELLSVKFIISASTLIGLGVYAIKTFKNKSLLSFIILYFFITISLVSNLLVDIGTPFSERLLFQPSLSFCMAGALFFTKTKNKYRIISWSMLVILLLLFSIKTISRNADWKNNETLYASDVISAPNSARTTLFASEIYREKAKKESNTKLKNEYLEKSVYYGEKSLIINPGLAVTYLHLGFAYFDRSEYDKAADLWIRGYQMNPADTEAKKCTEILSTIFYKQGNGLSESGRTADAIKSYLKSVELNEANAEAWYNLGGNYLLENDTLKANRAWKKVKMLEPDHSFDKDDFLNN